MKRILFFLLIVTSHLKAGQELRLAAESEPLLTIANCVNLMGGAFYQVDQDLVVDGPLPLSYTRHYDSGDGDPSCFNNYGYGVGLGHPLFVKYRVDLNKKEYLYVEQRHRYKLPFQYTAVGQNFLKAVLNPFVYDHGYTNCTEALERRQPCLAHVDVTVHKNSNLAKVLFDVIDADGTKRAYIPASS